MTVESTYDMFASDPERLRLLRQEELILEVTEAIEEVLEAAEIPRVELARRMGKSRSLISQLLSGERNFTLRTLADVATALDLQVAVHFRKPASPVHAEDWEYPPLEAPESLSVMQPEPAPGPPRRGRRRG